MKALILAAGLGTRLAPLTDNCPKSLVEVNGEPILMRQIDNLHKNGICDITVISGYKAEILENTVHSKYPEINIIRSTDYAITNNMYSAYLARHSMGEEGFLMMNADVFCDASVIRALLEFPFSDAIVVDIGKYLDESMKVVQEGGRIVHISKEICREEALGTSIDVYRFSAEGGKAFFEKCEEYIGRGEIKLWSEVALNDILSDIVFRACPIQGRWLEIDNHDDLAEACKLFAD